MRITASCVLIFFTQCIWSGRALNPTIGILADMQLAFPALDQIAAAALMACQHIQKRDSRLVSSELSADFNVTCNFVDHTYSSKTQVAEAALHWAAMGADFMVGAMNSETSGPLAVIGELYEIPVVGHWSTSESLSDKSVYPYFGRTIPAALTVPRAVLKFIASMGWTNFGHIYGDDASGNSNNNAYNKYAREDGLHVLSSQQFNRDDAESIRYAVKGLAASGAKIVITSASLTDSLLIMEAADEEGIIGAGYIYFGGISSPQTLFAQSKNATRTLELVSGWMFPRSDPFAEDAQWQRFDEVWKSEKFENVEIADVDGVVHRPMPATVNDADCFSICGYIYDAVWTAALAMDRSTKAASGEIVPGEVLAAWRELQFEGATGSVLFDERLDRGPGVPTVLVQWVPVEASDGTKSIVMTDIASWEGGSSVFERYEFPDKSAPAWKGGKRGWDAVPDDGSACAKGEVLSLASLQCEPCPAGAFQNGTRCELCAPGYHAPVPAMLQCVPCLETGYAARAGMPACTPCAGNYEMRADAIHSTSDQDCVCRSGYTAGCSWPVWQVLVVVTAAILCALLAHAAWKWSRAQEEGEEELQHRLALLRRLLRLRPEHGFRFPTEPRSLAQWLGLAPQRLIRPRPLKHLAMLTLLRRFDGAAVDALSVLFQALAEQEELDAETDALWAEQGRGPDSSVPSRAGSAHSHRSNVALNHRQLTLCNIVIHVSCQLLDPNSSSPEGGAMPAVSKPRLREPTGTVSHELLLVAVPGTHSAEDRFRFFCEHIAQLSLWEEGDAFGALKAQLQLSLDALRIEMDSLFASLVAEDGGAELVAWAPPVAHAEGEDGTIQRQDHPRVNAIRFDEHARKQIAVFKELPVHPPPPRSSPRSRLPPASNDASPVQATPVAGPGGRRMSASGSGSATPHALPAPSRVSSCGSLPGGASAEWARKKGQVERQFVEQLHLQSCVLNDSFQRAVQDSIQARAKELHTMPVILDDRGEASHGGPLNFATDSDEHTPHVQVSAGAIKTVKRMLEKVKTYAEEARSGRAELAEPYTAHVLDPVRACVICRNSRELLEMAKWMLDNGTECGLPAVRVKNKFAVKDSSEYDGYRDLMLSVLHTGTMGLRIVGEVQFHDVRMYALKVQMHRLYKVKRAASAATI